MSDSFKELITTLDQIIRCLDQQTKIIADIYGLSNKQLDFLKEIHVHKNNTISKLMKYTDMTQYKVTSVLDYLFEKDLITRRQDTEDKRAWVIVVSSKGDGMLEKISQMQRSFIQKFSGLPAEEQSGIISTLQHLLNLCNNNTRKSKSSSSRNTSSSTSSSTSTSSNGGTTTTTSESKSESSNDDSHIEDATDAESSDQDSYSHDHSHIQDDENPKQISDHKQISNHEQTSDHDLSHDDE